MSTAVDRGGAGRAGSGGRGSGGWGAPAPPVPVGRLPRRRRWAIAAVGVALVAVGAVVAYLLVVTAGVTRPYLAVSRPVPYGAVIAAGDLAVVDVNQAAGLAPIPAAERDQIVGLYAATGLLPGTLLTRAQLTDRAVPGPGEHLVGVELGPAQIPARTLTAGDAVLLVIVAAANLTGVTDPEVDGSGAGPRSMRATVVAATRPANDGKVRVDVVVDQGDALTVAAMAAAGRIVLVLTSRGR